MLNGLLFFLLQINYLATTERCACSPFVRLCMCVDDRELLFVCLHAVCVGLAAFVRSEQTEGFSRSRARFHSRAHMFVRFAVMKLCAAFTQPLHSNAAASVR